MQLVKINIFLYPQRNVLFIVYFLIESHQKLGIFLTATNALAVVGFTLMKGWKKSFKNPLKSWKIEIKMQNPGCIGIFHS